MKINGVSLIEVLESGKIVLNVDECSVKRLKN
jgi:hypothetical protein